MSPRRIVFDLDDTLVSTSPLYHQATWECGLIIHHALGPASPYPLAVIEKQIGIDRELMTANSYHPERFPASWVMTYQDLAAAAGQPIRPEVVKSLLRVARMFHYGPYRTRIGAIATLDQLAGRGFQLFCVTAGWRAEELQLRKLQQTGLDRFFPKPIITAADKTAALRRLFRGASRMMVVGDSLDHDVQPTVAIGASAVLIRSQCWTSFQPQTSLDPSRYRIINELPELPGLVTVLEAQGLF